MFLTSRYQFVATMGLVLSLTSCADREFVIRPPAPERLPSLEHPIRGIADSVINVPVRVDMSGFLDAVNNPNLI
ncbi:MAG TPA: hypothetical protein DDY39_18480, partial [Nitrospira sp.]|nr:hypothetical protein [Nitrospira sp.]